MKAFEEMMQVLIDERGTDLHLQPGSPPLGRIRGDLTPLEEEKCTPEYCRDMARKLMGEDAWKAFQHKTDYDFGHYALESNDLLFRLRCNAYHEMGHVALALRMIRSDILDFEQLHLPTVCETLAQELRGLVLVTGITGSGKSTTLATMLDYINRRRKCHIITIEDPIEFVHPNKSSLVTQREIGKDAPSFYDALRYAVRQDPDVILVGEMRDVETIRTAISAAETGHLVFSTLHVVEAPGTVERIISFFPGDEQVQVRAQLSLNLKGVISQRLLRRKGGPGLVPALEILVSTALIRKLILDGKLKELREAIKQGEAGMQTFNQALMGLIKEDLIEVDDALQNADNVAELQRMVKGGVSGGDVSAIIGAL